VKAIAAVAKETYAVTNNHRHGQAPANAAMLEGLVTGERVAVPNPLLEAYADELRPFARGAGREAAGTARGRRRA